MRYTLQTIPQLWVPNKTVLQPTIPQLNNFHYFLVLSCIMAMTKDNITYLTNEKRSFKLGVKVVVCACNLPNSHPMSAPQWQQHKSQPIVAWHIQYISWDIIQLKTRWVSVNKSQHLNGNPKGSRKSNITKCTSFRYLLRWLINKNSWLNIFADYIVSFDFICLLLIIVYLLVVFQLQ